MLIPMPSPCGTNRANLYIDVPSRGATDAAISLHSKPRRYGDRRLGRDAEQDNRQGYLSALLGQIENLSPEDKAALIDAMLDAPAEDRRRARDNYPVEERDISDPGEIGEVERLQAGDRRRVGGRDEPPPFYGRPRPGGSIDLTREGEGDRARRHAMDMAFDIRIDTVATHPSKLAKRAGSTTFDQRWPKAARIRVL